MCGIVGYLNPRLPPEEREAAVARMSRALFHRGPDQAGLVSRGAVTLGAQRLAIFDPEHGAQPWRHEAAGLDLVFNGAIYNHRELRPELIACGHRFRSQCDTEVLLFALLQWGDDCLQRLRGMYAFALWREKDRSLLLARDPFGIKPLYFRHEPGSDDLWFASEIRAFAAADPRRKPHIDPRGVIGTLAYLAPPAPITVYQSVSSLRPGEACRWRDGRLERWRHGFFTTRRTSSPHLARPDPRDSSPQLNNAAELRLRIEDSVRAHVQADVPVGVLLSGGLDSAVVTGLAARSLGRSLPTFTVAFGHEGASEDSDAAVTARHFGCTHHVHTVTGQQVARDLPRWIAGMDQPTGDGLNTFYASAAARAGGVKVALSGLGGDELFGGYGFFRRIAWLDRLRRAVRLLPAGLRESRPSSRDSRREKFLSLIHDSPDLHTLAAESRRVWSRRALSQIIHPDLRANLAPDEAAMDSHPAGEELRAFIGSDDARAVLAAWETRAYLSDVLLRDADVASLQHSLELRVPLVDAPLIESGWRLPIGWRMSAPPPKAALAQAMADLLPPELRTRRKQGFTLPLARWMRRELRPRLDEMFSVAHLQRSGLFSATATEAAWKQFRDGSDDRAWSRLWTLAMTIAWLDHSHAA